MKYLIGIIGIIVVLLMAWAFSKDKKKNQVPSCCYHDCFTIYSCCRIVEYERR